jgi:hypothetical protein
MQSFARRGIRTTVAVAGLAVLGVGLAAPTAFALPGVPDIGGIGNTRTAPSATDSAAQPGRFHFTPSAAEQSTANDAERSTAAEPGDEEATDPEDTASTDAEDTQGENTRAQDTDGQDTDGRQTEATDSDATDSEDADANGSREAAPAATPGLLPQLPGPVAAQASPQLSGVDPSSALQGLNP